MPKLLNKILSIQLEEDEQIELCCPTCGDTNILKVDSNYFCRTNNHELNFYMGIVNNSLRIAFTEYGK